MRNTVLASLTIDRGEALPAYVPLDLPISVKAGDVLTLGYRAAYTVKRDQTFNTLAALKAFKKEIDDQRAAEEEAARRDAVT
jgi:diaminopimelate decarboxylase